MSDQTGESGLRLEELYAACKALPPGERAAFIQRRAGNDAGLIKQLTQMLQMADTVTASPGPADTAGGGAVPWSLASGAVFGDCQIVNEIGAGAMGVVYLAREIKAHRRLVALKVMNPKLLGEVALQRFSDESAALSRLAHPNIAHFYSHGIQPWEQADRPFLVMEYVNGQTLDQYLIDHPLSAAEKIDLLQKICKAVHHGHLMGVFHRDLKPSNILVTEDGEPKIIDFGVSFMISTELSPEGNTTRNENVGTPRYMAPEAAGGQQFIPDPRTDVYSLGIIAFEIFASRRPGFLQPREDELELVEAPTQTGELRQLTCTCERESLRRDDSSLGSDLKYVVGKAVRLTKEQRYSDASEFAEDLRRVVSFEPITARPPSRLYSAKMFARRNALAVTSTAVIFVLIGVTAIGLAFGEMRASASQRKTQAALQLANQRKEEIEQQVTAAHVRAGHLAEQRGRWAMAANEYHAAMQGNSPDRLDCAVGELRAWDHLGQKPEGEALIQQVHASMPDIAQTAEFMLVEGLFYWSTKPEQSVRSIVAALKQPAGTQPGQFNRADRAFAEALITDDIHVFAPKLRETVDADPFNRDAWAMLALTDLMLGDAVACEHDAMMLHSLYPEDQTGAALAVAAAAFQGRRDAAMGYLNSATALPDDLKRPLAEVVDVVGDIRSYDDISQATLILQTPSLFLDVLSCISRLRKSESMPTPTTFKPLSELAEHLQRQGVIAAFSQANLILTNFSKAMPNGVGHCAAGMKAMAARDYPEAVQQLETAISAPSLIDCRRYAAMLLTVADNADLRKRNAPENKVIDRVTNDLDRLISLGGIRPDVHPGEDYVLQIGLQCGLSPQVGSLAMGWLMRSPGNADATFFLAWSDEHQGDRQSAIEHYNQAIRFGLSGDRKTDAINAISKLTAPAATRPGTGP